MGEMAVAVVVGFIVDPCAPWGENARVRGRSAIGDVGRADGDSLVRPAGGLGGGVYGETRPGGGGWGSQQQYGLTQLRAIGRAPESVVADAVDSRRQNMRETAADVAPEVFDDVAWFGIDDPA